METDLYALAQALAGRPVERLIRSRSGRNSQVYQVLCGNASFALKSYPSRTLDTRDRMGTELKALQYYQNNPYVPRLLSVDIPQAAILLEWIEGSMVSAPGVADLDQALDFIARTHAADNGADFELASEPCLCAADLYRHISQRLEKLHRVADAQLAIFLTEELQISLAKASKQAQGAKPLNKPALIPADFGFHNAIKTAAGKLYFIDFEYFGRDDPVRLAADFLLHPGMQLDLECQARFRQGMTDIYQADKDFEPRLLQLLPLYGLRWTLLLLNEFLPERWQARVFAGEQASWPEIKTQQLEKARIALAKANACLYC